MSFVLSGISGLSFDSFFLSALLLLCLVLLLPSSPFSGLTQSPACFLELKKKEKKGIFCMALQALFLVFVVLVARTGDVKLVSDKCSIPPYGSGISNFCI